MNELNYLRTVLPQQLLKEVCVSCCWNPKTSLCYLMAIRTEMQGFRCVAYCQHYKPSVKRGEYADQIPTSPDAGNNIEHPVPVDSGSDQDCQTTDKENVVKYKIHKLTIGGFELLKTADGDKRVQITTPGVTMEMPWAITADTVILRRLDTTYAIDIRAEDESEIIRISGLIKGDKLGYTMTGYDYNYIGTREDGGINTNDGILLGVEKHFAQSVDDEAGGLILAEVVAVLKNDIVQLVLSRVQERLGA